MKISHEVPTQLLELSRSFNDYDYALVHLFEINPDYYNFYVESLKQGRMVILDNSAYELGKSFDVEKFYYWIDQLNPTWYIIPDDKKDLDNNNKLFEDWLSHKKPANSLSIGVVHGRDWDEFVENYKKVASHCDVISISMEDWFKDFHVSANSYQSFTWGRQEVIRNLSSAEILSKKPHHLLGCLLPQEFAYYKLLPNFNLQSIDTSNPVVHGILGIRYDEEGINCHSSVKLADLINTKLTLRQLRDVFHNIYMFRKINL